MKKAFPVCLLFFILICAPVFAASSGDFESVKPLLAAKCGICHASDMKHPFSSKIPVWNHLTGTHTGLARKKYDMDGIFTDGAAADSGQLLMLENVVRSKTMPPFQYKLLHPGMRLSAEERARILDWIYNRYPDWKPAV